MDMSLNAPQKNSFDNYLSGGGKKIKNYFLGGAVGVKKTGV